MISMSSILLSSTAIAFFSIPAQSELCYAHSAHNHRRLSECMHSWKSFKTRSRPACLQATDDEALSRLKSWMTVCGAELSALDVGVSHEGLRGVMATEATDPNLKVALRVPVALALSDDPEEFRETPFGQAVPASEWLRIPVDMRLSLRLLAEKAKGAESCWKDFISLLPAEYTSARHLSDACLRQAGSPFVTEQAGLCKAYLTDMHIELSRLGSQYGAPVPSLEELGWALDAVHTRSFTVDAGEERGVRRYLIPFVDMLNHDENCGCGFAYDEDNECFEVRRFGGEPLNAGDQIFLDYGAKSSEEMLVMYGFVPSTVGEADAITLGGAYTTEDLAAAPGDEDFRREKVELLNLFRYSAPRTFQIAPGNVDPAIVCALRLALLTPAELESECAGSWYRAVVHAPVSDDNEQRVAQALRRRLQDALESDKSSIEEDEALLLAEGSDLDDAMRCAVQLRLNRKRLLAELIRIVKSFSGRPRGSNLLDALGEYMPRVRML